jgi:serine phosphatase RsbU (regulator of sigma subunit)
VEVASEDPVVEYFRSASDAVELDRLDLDSPALRRLKSSSVKIVLPLISQAQLIGWLSLGPRLSEQGYSADDRALLARLAFQAAPAVRVAQLARQRQAETLERERMDHEMSVARIIQQTLLPKELPSLPGWQVAAYWQPARAVGGDFYDFMPLPDGRLAVVVADVADKGVPAAMIMASARVILRGTARRMLTPSVALALANDLLFPEIPDNMFITCLYAILDPASGRLQFANAGHNLPCRFSRDAVTELRATGMPLGLLPGMHYEEQETTIQPDESLLLYSDGLVEAHNSQGEMFGYERLHTLLAKSYLHSTPDPIEGLLAELADFTGSDWEQEDDVTMVTLHRS